MTYIQTPPALGNQYRDDPAFRSYLRRALPVEVLRAIEPSLDDLGALAGGDLYRLQLDDRLNEPRHTPWDAWGNRVDRVETSPLWWVAEPLAARLGLIACAYERTYGAWSRLQQFALVHLFTPSTGLFSCPLAMTDGATRVLELSGNRALVERAMPHLLSRDPSTFWTSGQWMTETRGGSDVGGSETVARRDGQQWRLYGRKWFCSAVTSPMALALARPEGNPPGGRGLALFYLEPRDAEGRWNNIQVERLKDKLGTRKVPTAELTLTGVAAQPVTGLTDGVRHIAPVLNITRVWNSVSAVSLMRRGVALARDYAVRRQAFGKPLAQQPLHLDTLAGLQAEMEAALHLTFHVVELLGRSETGEADDEERARLRLLTPIVKLLTGRQAVAVLSEVLEAFGGAGYVEDTGLPMLLRDAQVLPIWEGTTNVLALDLLRALGDTEGVRPLEAAVAALAEPVSDGALAEVARAAGAAVSRAGRWLQEASGVSPAHVEAGARRFALTLGRAMAAALLARHAQWSLDNERDGRARAAALRFRRHGLDLIGEGDPDENALLVG